MATLKRVPVRMVRAQLRMQTVTIQGPFGPMKIKRPVMVVKRNQ